MLESLSHFLLNPRGNGHILSKIKSSRDTCLMNINITYKFFSIMHKIKTLINRTMDLPNLFLLNKIL